VSTGCRAGSLRCGWLALAAASALALLACAAERRPPNLLLVVLDTLRADRLGAYGSTRALTPFLDELAARGVVFERAYATSSWTSPSIASLFTSRHPIQHGIVGFESVLGQGEATLAESLRAQGFSSGGFSANFRIAENLGYGQGFDVWRAYLASTDERDHGPKVPARFVREQALDWLAGVWHRESPRPVFLYLHFMEPHSPYDPPDPVRERLVPRASRAEIDAANAVLLDFRFDDLSDQQVALLAALYDAEVAALDAELRTLFAALDANGFLEHSIVVVVADHGEEFREHGKLLHGITLFEPGVRVPWLLIAPGLAAGRRLSQPVSLLDVAPTLLDLLGAPVQARFEGHSLLPLLRGSEAASGSGDILLDLAPKFDAEEVRTHSRGLVRGARKLLVDPQGPPRVFDLARDPGELAASGSANEVRELLAALERARDDLGSRAGAPVPAASLDAGTRENLRALGYLPGPDPAP
jgi:arylsulfatase A-like enzyme